MSVEEPTLQPPFDAYSGNEAYIFVSYAHKDKAAVYPEINWLHELGYRVWYDEDINVGSEWPAEVEKAVENCALFLVYISPTAIESVNVRNEINLACLGKKEIRVVYLVETKLRHGLKLQIGTIQGILKYELLAHRYQSKLLKSLPIEVKGDPVKEVLQLKPRSEILQIEGNRMILTLAKGVSLELVQIPAGKFFMGSDKSKDKMADDDETTQHTLYLPEYWMGKYPVTVAQFSVFVWSTSHQTRAEKTGSGWGYDGSTDKWGSIKGASWQSRFGPGRDVNVKSEHPVKVVDWDDARAFCQWVNARIGRQDLQARLPSEAEWEKAARGTDGRIYPWGNKPPDNRRCNFNWNVDDTTLIGSYSPLGDSPYDCVDMVGNVWEWTNSLHNSYPYQLYDGREDTQASGTRVLRGGSFCSNENGVRCAVRFDRGPNYIYYDAGLRLCVSPIQL